MGTRADFYIGRGPDAEWLGSIAWDGYPGGIPDAILVAPSEDEFRVAVTDLLSSRDDGTTPDMGWPWPWKDSQTSNYAYAWDKGVWFTIDWKPSRWWRYADGAEPNADDEGYDDLLKTLDVAVFPDMTDRQNVTLGGRSGLIIFSA